MNKLLTLIRGRHAPCEKFVCTTCGGLSMFIRDIESVGLRSDDLVQCLTQITGPEIEPLEKKAMSFIATLKVLSQSERVLVIAEWTQRVSSDPALAQGVLLWTNYGRDLPAQELSIVLEAAVPKLLLRRDIREQLLSTPNLPDPLPNRLAAAIKSDEDETRRQRDEEVRSRQARQQYFRSLAEMPFEQRVPAIVGDKSIDPYRNWREWQGWGSEWGRCSDKEIEKLSAESTQLLIDLCETNLVVRFSEVLPRLYDRRHSLRQSAMDEIRRKYSSMGPRDQLTELVSGSVQIEHFPVELAKEVTDEWLSSLTEEQRSQFVTQISACKLRVWIKARRTLSGQAPGQSA